MLPKGDVMTNTLVRPPAVANQFYDGDPVRLNYELGKLIGPVKNPEPAFAVIAPHAGYIYSGRVAGKAYAKVIVPQNVVILGPNHTGMGAATAIMTSGVWAMPLGNVPVNSELATQILANSSLLVEDIEAHWHEHSLEVQVPFLQYRQPNLSIVPICLGHISYEACEEIGLAIAKAIKAYGQDVLIVASTDLTHYENQKQAEMKDSLVIDKILSMDPKGLYETVLSYGISMCGIMPTTATLVASIALGASQSELVAYATSGDITGDYSSVVGYASFLIK